MGMYTWGQVISSEHGKQAEYTGRGVGTPHQSDLLPAPWPCIVILPDIQQIINAGIGTTCKRVIPVLFIKYTSETLSIFLSLYEKLLV